VGLADRDALRVRDGDAASVTFDAEGTREFHGRVRQVAAAADPRTGTYTVEVSLDGVDALPSGLVGRVRIGATGGARAVAATEAIAIPAEALVEGGEGHGVVFVLDRAGRIALRRSVTLIGVDGDRVLVGGLDPAARVITAGAAWLTDSARVEVKP
jgi:multidrug efflux system membrane fusion protein